MKNLELLISKLIRENDNDVPLNDLAIHYIKRCTAKTRPATVTFYEEQLGYILKYLKSIDVTHLDQLDHNTLFRYIDYQKARKLKNNTINKSITVLKQVLRFAYKTSLINYDPLKDFDLLAKDDIETKIIETEYIHAIFKYLEIQENTEYYARNKAILHLLFDTGIRINELLEIKIDDLDFANNQIHLKYTKTKRNRTIFLSDTTVSAMINFMNFVKPTEYVFILGSSRTHLSRKTLYKFLYTTKRNLNIPDEVSISFHKFRHTYATVVLEQGASLEFVRKTLGHSDLSTTQKYLHLSTKHLQKEHELYSPINQIKSGTCLP